MGAPKLLQDNVFAAGLLLASSTAVGTAVAAIGDLRPFTWYRPATLPATVTVDLDAARAADSALLYAHNLASMGCEVQIRGSTDAFASSDVLVATISPATDGPQWSAWSSVSYRSWRLRIDGPGTPALDLDFAGLKALPAGVTFARASIGTYFDAAGVLRTAAAGEARFTHDPLRGTSLGLMVEEARTNRLPYSTPIPAGQNVNPGWAKAVGTETLTFAQSADNPTGVATEYVASLTTSSAGAGLNLTGGYTPAWAANQSYSKTIFWKNDGGDPSVRVDLVLGTTGQRRYAVLLNFAGGGAPVVTDQSGGTLTDYAVKAVRLPGGWWSISLTGNTGGTPPSAGQAWIYVLKGTGTMKCRLWGGQLEDGAFPTSYIPTAGATVTRAADSATMTGSAFSAWWNATEGSMLGVWRLGAIKNATAFTDVIGVNDATANNRIDFGANSDSSLNYANVNVTTGGVSQANFFQTVTETTGEMRAAMAYKANDFALSLAGAAVSTDTAGTVPTVTQAQLGFSFGNGYLNGTIARVTYWPKRLTNAQLQWLTAADCGSITEPSLAIAMVGTALAFPYGIEQPFDPVGREVGGRSLQNNNGEPLGAVVDFEEWEATLAFRGLSWAWVRSSFLPAWDAGLKSKPFAFAWMPDLYPGEVRLCTAASRKFSAAHGSGSLCDLSFPVRGRA